MGWSRVETTNNDVVDEYLITKIRKSNKRINGMIKICKQVHGKK